MALKQYVIDEIAQDCREGLLTRRDAMRRLGFLGVGAALATTLLAGCSDDEGDPTVGSQGGNTTGSAGGSTAPSTAGSGELIKFTGPAGELIGSFKAATSPKGAVLIVHENRGLTEHFVNLPARLAGDGYTALAVDLLSRRGGTAAQTDQAAVPGLLTGISDTDRVADLRAGVSELQKRASGQKVGVMGFCFGGGMVWNLLQAGEERLAAAVPFYGPAPDPADFKKAKAAVLAIYGGNDTRVNESRPRAEAALKAANLTHEIKVFDGADHAFFNETGQRYNPTAAADAYRQVLAWFGNHLKT